LTGWASKLKKLPMIELSHQASMSFLKHLNLKKRFLGEMILKYYVPSERRLVFILKIIILRLKNRLSEEKSEILIPTSKGIILFIFRVLQMKISLKF
jgi:hypothetical protein